MPTFPSLPQSWLCLSSMEERCHTLELRFLPESILPENALALILTVDSVKNLDAVRKYLTSARTKEEYLGLSWVGTALALETEFGEEIVLEGESFVARNDSINATELRLALNAAQPRYESECTAARELRLKLSRTREMIQEQMRRLEIKDVGHVEGSVAHVLYRQHAELLDRVRRETEA